MLFCVIFDFFRRNHAAKIILIFNMQEKNHFFSLIFFPFAEISWFTRAKPRLIEYRNSLKATSGKTQTIRQKSFKMQIRVCTFLNQ